MPASIPMIIGRICRYIRFIWVCARSPKLENKTAELTDRLLSYVDREVRSAVHSLSASRAFDEDLYVKLGADCHFQASSANFEILTGFSFVWKSQKRGDNWYRIHDLLRRLDADRDDPKTRKAHEILERHYREVGNVAEAIFHANRLDWQRGVEEWKEVFDEALEKSRYGECKSLLEVRDELWIKSDYWLGRVSRSEGDYYAQFARYVEAKQEYLEAVAAYNSALLIASDDINALNNKGNALQSLGKLQAKLSEFEAAKLSYFEAIAACNSALLIAPDFICALNSKGIALLRLGNLQAILSEFEAAKQSYFEALAACNSALLIAPDDIAALKNKGNALRSLGELQAKLSEFEAAKQSYFEALAAWNSALLIAPDDLGVLNNKGNALQSLGELQAKLSEFEAAKQSYFEAIAALNSVLLIAPDYIAALTNKGNALRCLGDLQEKLFERQDALKNWQEALSMFDRSLAIAPNRDWTRNSRDWLQEFIDNLGEDTVSS